MIKSNIGIPGKDPRSWRGKRRKPKPAQAVPTIIEGVRSPQEIARERRRRRIIPLPE
jgi:hypothetical protein